MSRPIEIFFSYAHEDERLMDDVRRQLIGFDRRDIIRKWHDREIPPGEEWKGQIDRRLRRSDIILLFVSPNFIASNYCYDVEMEEALLRHKSGAARVIPIILRPCSWQEEPFGRFQALPTDGRALTKWRNRDEGALNIAEGVMRVVREWSRGKKNDAPDSASKIEKGKAAFGTHAKSDLPIHAITSKNTTITAHGHLTDGDARKSVIAACLQRMAKDRNAFKVVIALDFCSFGAFGDFSESERQTELIKETAHRLQNSEASVHMLVNSPGARKWQLDQFFSKRQWNRNGNRWKAVNIPKFASHKRYKLPNKCRLQTENQTITREGWIALRLHFENFVEKDFRRNNVSVTCLPGIVPFHAWLCDVRHGTPYGVFALCHHQTAATAELLFSIEGEGVRHLIELAHKLFSAKKPDNGLLRQSWKGLIPKLT